MTTTYTPQASSTIAARFWSKVNKNGPVHPVLGTACWLWTASTGTEGYGQIYVTGSRPIGAHRVSYELHNGPMPDGMIACHHCDNPPCVNPAHLFVGTYQDNERDKIAKGRRAPNPIARITVCVNGHAYSPDNTRRDARGFRYCLTCKREKKRTFDARQRAVA